MKGGDAAWPAARRGGETDTASGSGANTESIARAVRHAEINAYDRTSSARAAAPRPLNCTDEDVAVECRTFPHPRTSAPT